MAKDFKFTPHTQLLSEELQTKLCPAACRLYAFIWNRMAIREATEINVRDTDSMDRARVKPEDLTAAQSQLHRHGLFHIEPVPNTRMIPGEQRTRYVTPEAEEVNTLKRKAFVKLPNQ